MKKGIALFVVLTLLTGMAGPGTAENLLDVENPTLINWSINNSVLLLQLMSSGCDVDPTGDNGIIHYRKNDVRTGSGGEKVADGGAYSQKGTYMLGMGAGVDREDLWYVTMTFRADGDEDMRYYNVFCMLAAFDDLYALMAGSEDESALFEGMLDRLVLQEGSVGIQYGGKVLMRKDLGTSIIIGVDSLPFYEAFYAGSLTEYYNLDE